MDRTAVTKIETGQRKVDSLELARLAVILNRPVSWFLSRSPQNIISRRADRDFSDESLADVILETISGDVSLLVECKVLEPPECYRPGSAVESTQTAEIAALGLRRFLGVDDGPLWELPDLGERVGLYAFVLDLGDASLDGSYVALEEGGVAVINGLRLSGRRRFTLAHELGHHVFDDEYSNEWILGSSGDDREKLINAFAVHFLMPRDSVSKRWNELDGDGSPRGAAIKISAEFGASWSATCSHLVNLGLIDDVTRTRLVRDNPRRFEYVEAAVRVREDLVPPVVPPRFASAVIKAYRSHKISEERAEQMMQGTVEGGELPPADGVPLQSMYDEMLLD